MKFSWKSAVTLSILAASTIVPVLSLADSASAQVARGMTGSYVGAGVSAGVSNPDDDTTFGGNVQGRYDLANAPISLRGSALISDGSAALMPIISYDVGIAPNTNLYLGAGYSFVTDDEDATPLGNQNAPVLTAGVETAVTRNIALYGDAKLGIDAYEGNSDSAVSLQLGAAYRF
ncbi:porin family protein [Oscillatoria sp. FACHB-1407]|uniref:outer membrane beta-barrel protein n=1 Tax=Oscillatoria sp. FACHB-1407 TaxID=2692847 RepID=UPI001682C62F|nr:outer membrane beta-barrel protein [Oscillatoria sp. FACHB-1407]MBD2461994.1 porin family protein [Oscillatoria sp. FACHB-1407]